MTKAANDAEIKASGPICPAGFEYLTGRKFGKQQAEVLRESGIRFSVRHDGSPSLTWESYNMQLCQQEQQNERKGPNLDFLNGRKA